MNRIRLDRPAEKWREALPAGNGHMGAMVYGGIGCEHVELTENTFFSGSRERNRKTEKKNSAEIFLEMREQIKKDEYAQAHATAESFIENRENYGTNLPVGTMEIIFSDWEDTGGCEYNRELCIDSGIITCMVKKGKHEIKRSLWISHPAKLGVYKIETNYPQDLEISFEAANFYGKSKCEGESIRFEVKAWETIHCDKNCGTNLYGGIDIRTDGKMRSIQNPDKAGLGISDSRNTIIYFAMETDFMQEKLHKTAVEERLAAGKEKETDLLLKEHVTDIKQWMEKCTLAIEGKEEWVRQIPLMFQYGRYLLLSSSREDSKLPAHLQGIWNDNVACRIGWTCDMHLDINTQMNYWPGEVTGLGKSCEPLFRWIKNELVPSGKKTAKEFYGMQGWEAELVSNAWGYTAPYWAVPLAPCPTGGVWILTHMWEHFLYSQDDKFLQEELLPAVEEAVRFFCSYLFIGKDGYYIGGPSISPENSFIKDGTAYQLSNGCTYEIVMIRELFAIYKEIGNRIPEQCDKELLNKVAVRKEKLIPYKIKEDGTIAEWNHEYEAADVQHRHTSHLLGLFPFAQLTPENTPELAAAAEKTILNKLTPESGWEDTGWARSMLLLYEARLGNQEACAYHIRQMLYKLLSSNCFIMHPPTRGAAAFDDVYELDGNTGMTSGIAEMLMQSHNGIIRLLPALPKEWENGEIWGLCARGNIRLDIRWKKGDLEQAVFYAEKDKTIRVVYKGKLSKINLKKGVPYFLQELNYYKN